MNTLRHLPSVLAALLTSLLPWAGRAQIALEHVYPNGSLHATNVHQLFMVDLEASGMKYVLIDRTQMNIHLYHLDHTHWKSVSFAMVTPIAGPFGIILSSKHILYISEHLFDLDDDLEFMYTDYQSGNASITQIVDETTGGVVFTVLNQIASVKSNYHQQQYPIYNTPDGTKMILSGSHGDDNAYVYALAGDLTTGIAETSEGQLMAGNIHVFPNPTNSSLTVAVLSHDTPLSMEILSAQGQLVRSDMLQGEMTTIDVGALAPGSYLYRVLDHGQVLRMGTFIRE